MRPDANFPTSVWDGDTDNIDRAGFLNDAAVNFQDYNRLATEIIAVQEYLDSYSDVASGTANGTTVTATESAGYLNKTVLDINVSIATTDHTTAGGHGSLKIYDFPQASLTILSVVPDLDVTVSGNLAADTTLNIGIGTAAVGVDNEALTSTEQDICSVGTVVCSGNTGTYGTVLAAPVTLDGTSTACDAILNIAADATGSTGTGAVAVVGTVTILWINGGDN